jgi:glucosamine--fructose-6-phosphate aminotransferase (isomerizing)
VLTHDNHIAQLALRYRFMQHCVVLGRGYNYATAFEWSLKLKELTYVVAEPYSSADFMHGPIAMVAGGFPVMAAAPRGVVFPDMLDLLQRLKDEYQAELVVVSDHPSALELATSPILLPEGIPESLTPIVGIVPAQLFCYHLTRIKGFDTEAPRGLRKVTHTH